METNRHERCLKQLRAVDGDGGVRVVEALARSFRDFSTCLVEYPFGDICSRLPLPLPPV